MTAFNLFLVAAGSLLLACSPNVLVYANDKNETSNTESKHKVREPCYDEWTEFRDDLNKAHATKQEKFVICPGSQFHPKPYSHEDHDKLITHANIVLNNTQILCGDDGSFDNDCTIKGGYSHLVVKRHAGTDLKVQGISFTHANDTSIIAYGPEDSTLLVKDCLFKHNVADTAAVMYIWHSDEENGNGMKVTLDGCSIVNNKGPDGIVVSEGGALTVTNTFFSTNERNWNILVHQGGAVSVTDSCFIDSYGPVYVYDESYLVDNSGNYGDNTQKDPDYDCSGVVVQGAGEECSTFKETSCVAASLGASSSNGGSSTSAGAVVGITLVVVAVVALTGFVVKRKYNIGFREKNVDVEDNMMEENGTETHHDGKISPNTLDFSETTENGDQLKPIYV